MLDCGRIEGVRTAIVYINPAINAPVYDPLARRFVSTYMDHPPGESDHTLHVIVNGMEPTEYHRRLFEPLPCHLHFGSNIGKDIGAFIHAAATIPCDLLVCFGAHVHFHRAGWLDRMVDVFLEDGPALYGPWGVPYPAGDHIRTTAFWLPPELLNQYPFAVGDPQRYAFERGDNSLTSWVLRMGYPAIAVTWSGAYPYGQWQVISREDSLVLDQWTSGER